MPATGMSQTPGAGNGVTVSAKAVICSPFSGPDGSLFDNDQAGNTSTGALCTGIGFGIGTRNDINPDAITPQFTDDYTPGVTLPDGTAATEAILLAIGGGRSAIVDGTGPDGNGVPPGTNVSVPNPYSAVGLCGFGNGASRDGAGGTAGFPMKLVTAAADVAHGAAIETGFANRVAVGYTLPDGNSAFGSATAAQATPT